jgi:hypothetical protein
MIFKKHFRKKWPGLAFFSGKSEREKFPEKINSSQQNQNKNQNRYRVQRPMESDRH